MGGGRKEFKTVLCYSIANFHTLRLITVTLGNWNLKNAHVSKFISSSIPPVILILLHGETKYHTIDIGLCFHYSYLYIYASIKNVLINRFIYLTSTVVFEQFKSFKTGFHLHYIWNLQLYLRGNRVHALYKDQSPNVV